mgnify:CR=1 FL=1
MAIVRWTPEDGAVDVVPADADVRTRVNEYGGGAWRVAPGVLAIVGGAALVFFLFPRHDRERELLAEYHRQDVAAAGG